MSRHIYHTTHNGRPVEVATGWDRPLRGFFLTVLYLDTPDGDDTADYEYAYNNLDSANPWPGVFAVFKAELDRLGITIPAAMISDVEADGRVNMGNKVRNWSNAHD